MKIRLTTLILILILNYSIITFATTRFHHKTIAIDATILFIGDVSVPYKKPIGKILTEAGIGLENPTQKFEVMIEYIKNKEKIFDIWEISSSILQEHLYEISLPATIEITYLTFIKNEFISTIRIDNHLIKRNAFFITNYRTTES